MFNHSSKPVTHLLEGALFDTARQLIKLEQEVRAFFPLALRNQIYAGGLHESGTSVELVLVVAHSAAAARIKQSLPSLLTHLHNKAWRVSSLRIKIQPQSAIVHKSTHLVPNKRAVLSGQGIDSLRHLSQALNTSSSDSPLQTALQALLAHHSH